MADYIPYRKSFQVREHLLPTSMPIAKFEIPILDPETEVIKFSQLRIILFTELESTYDLRLYRSRENVTDKFNDVRIGRLELVSDLSTPIAGIIGPCAVSYSDSDKNKLVIKMAWPRKNTITGDPEVTIYCSTVK